MFEFIRKFFATAKKPRTQYRARPALEEFERRELPSASSWLGSLFHLSASQQATLRTDVAKVIGDVKEIAQQCQSQGQSQTLTATLTGVTGASGSVTFRSNSSSSGNNSLDVVVSGLSDNATYTVTSGTTTIGTINTNANGQGQLAVSDLSGALTAGATITITDSTGATALSGILATSTTQHSTTLSASLSGATGTHGRAYIRTNSSGSQYLRLYVSGLSADSTYNVQVNGNTVSQVVTNSLGRGSFFLSDVSAAAASGSTITVTDGQGNTVLQGTFAVETW